MTYPKYYRYGNDLHKVIDEKTVIDVCEKFDDSLFVRLSPNHSGLVDLVERKGRTIEKIVFDNTLQSALTKLNALVQKENEQPDIFNQIADIVRPELVNDADDLKDINI